MKSEPRCVWIKSFEDLKAIDENDSNGMEIDLGSIDVKITLPSDRRDRIYRFDNNFPCKTDRISPEVKNAIKREQRRIDRVVKLRERNLAK
jgi:hypothetical protein